MFLKRGQPAGAVNAGRRQHASLERGCRPRPVKCDGPPFIVQFIAAQVRRSHSANNARLTSKQPGKRVPRGSNVATSRRPGPIPDPRGEPLAVHSAAITRLSETERRVRLVAIRGDWVTATLGKHVAAVKRRAQKHNLWPDTAAGKRRTPAERGPSSVHHRRTLSPTPPIGQVCRAFSISHFRTISKVNTERTAGKRAAAKGVSDPTKAELREHRGKAKPPERPACIPEYGQGTLLSPSLEHHPFPSEFPLCLARGTHTSSHRHGAHPLFLFSNLFFPSFSRNPHGCFCSLSTAHLRACVRGLEPSSALCPAFLFPFCFLFRGLYGNLGRVCEFLKFRVLRGSTFVVELFLFPCFPSLHGGGRGGYFTGFQSFQGGN